MFDHVFMVKGQMISLHMNVGLKWLSPLSDVFINVARPEA